MRATQATEVDPKVAPIAPSTSAPKQEPVKRGHTPELEAAIGAHMRAARITAHMSQTALGVAVGISFQQVQKYEEADRVAASTLQGFGAALGVHPESFFDSDMPAPSGSIPVVKVAMRIAERIQRVRDPVAIKRLMVLVDLLAGEDDETGQSFEDSGGAPRCAGPTSSNEQFREDGGMWSRKATPIMCLRFGPRIAAVPDLLRQAERPAPSPRRGILGRR